jgi:hypothetical protein
VEPRKTINTVCGQNMEILKVTSGGTCNYHCDLNGEYDFLLKCSIFSDEGHVVLRISTNVSEEHIACIFRFLVWLILRT